MNIQQNFPITPTRILPPAQKLHDEFVRLGGMRLKLKNRMLAILPEIYESNIWKKYAGSIVEYAGKFGDIAKTTVIKRLRLEENLKDKLFLKAAIEKIGIHKVAMVAKITTPELDESMAENLLNMSKSAVQSLSKELRAGQYVGDVALPTPLCKAVALTKKIELDEKSTFLFLKLKAKLGKNLSDKELLKLLLEEREKQEFPQKKGEIVEKVASAKSITGDAFQTPSSRYVPAEKNRQTIAQTNGHCAYPNCNSPYEILHHADRYSESKSHDSLIPLCKVHHEFAHNNLIKNERQRADQWDLTVRKEVGRKISQADILYKKYRNRALA